MDILEKEATLYQMEILVDMLRYKLASKKDRKKMRVQANVVPLELKTFFENFVEEDKIRTNEEKETNEKGKEEREKEDNQAKLLLADFYLKHEMFLVEHMGTAGFKITNDFVQKINGGSNNKEATVPHKCGDEPLIKF